MKVIHKKEVCKMATRKEIREKHGIISTEDLIIVNAKI